AAAEFYLRAASKEALAALIQRGIAVAEGAAAMTGARLTITPGIAYDDVRPSYTLGRLIKGKLAAAGLEERTGSNSRRKQTGPGPYSTDLGNVSRRVPTAAIQFAISEAPIRGHSTEVVGCSISDLGRDNAIKTGKALALAAVDLLLDPSIVETARAELRGAP